jgi:energy-coupling factor transporter ATP-binding protein EcfA2
MTDKTAPPISQGSAWRRWDPHVHLPGTLFNDEFGGSTVVEALEELAACDPPIEAVGITDYFTTASYREARSAWGGGAAPSIKYMFPNVELRLNVPTAGGSPVNVHLLCAPKHVDWLDDFVARLEFRWQDRPYRADKAGLIALGRAYREQPDLPDLAALKAGAMQFKVDFNQLSQVYRDDASAPEHCLVAFAANEGDGTSGVRTEDGAFVALRQSMERFADIIFSSFRQQREFWLGHRDSDPPERIVERYGGLKPCLHGSDAHSMARLGKPSSDRFTWLKGDPCFDTLRLACLAPESRAAIGPSDPGGGNQHGRIGSLHIQDQAWFPQGTIPVNTGLVAIIGSRGSGKTALADLIAAGAGSTEPFENSASFISRARPLLENVTATVGWHGGETTECDISGADVWESDRGRVRYLSQQFVERLCASDGVSDELLNEIERVIYNTWPVDQRQGAIDFRDLLGIRLSEARGKQRAELEAITQISEQITEQRVLHNSLSQKREQLCVLETAADTLRGQIEALTVASDSRHAERYGVVSGALASRREALQVIDRRMTDLRALRASAQTASSSSFPRFVEQLRGRYANAGLTDEQWLAFLPSFSVDVVRMLSDELESAALGHAAVLGENPAEGVTFDGTPAEDLPRLTVSQLRAEQSRLEQLVGLDKTRATQLRRLQDQAAETRAGLVKLRREIEEAEKAIERIIELAGVRAAHYEAYFNAILDEEEELRQLYAPLDRILDEAGGSTAKLRFVVRRRVDARAWAEQGEELLDLRTSGPFHGAGEMERIAKTQLEGAWAQGDGAAAAGAITEFAAAYSDDLRAQSRVPRTSDSQYREWERSVSLWLYGVGHIRVTYSLEYDSLDVQRLSPGTRGIVLLLLYLAIDQAETDPLLIDQPEENLDPESVYTELVGLFRRASERRQIIMVTHNANLVVNSDVDQVVIAHRGQLEENALPVFSYAAGGLENFEIRQQVCAVLEGGAQAFRQRARRLQIDAPAYTSNEVLGEPSEASA